uniref:Uncharacterized protein n=1 Tax=Anguilla anguilla TaxID=7936 RepID=A0A0E9QCK9_ANGAN
MPKRNWNCQRRRPQM